MCGRFAFYSPKEAVAALFGVDPDIAFEPRYNIAPTQLVPVIRGTPPGGREMTMLRWGLVPFWAKDASIGNRMINARAETLGEKPAYRNAFRKRRCLILADGFYEWRQEANGKTPYFISLTDSSPFAFAGLWETWTDKATGEVFETTTIVTTAANRYLEDLHHRMPVVLQAETATVWLSGDPAALDIATANFPQFQAWAVDRKVNNARSEGPELIQPAA